MPMTNSPASNSPYIAVEGPIGVGKTSLASLLAERLGATLLLERFEENPFLEDFYRDRQRYAFQTQIYFLLSRFQHQQQIWQGDLFARGGVVADYMLAKDRLFASINLREEELKLYDRLWQMLTPKAPQPDLVILLLASAEVLKERIKRRNRGYEKGMEPGYLQELTSAYASYFFTHCPGPLLVVDTSEIDFVRSQADLEHLLAVIREHRGGIRHYKPLGS